MTARERAKELWEVVKAYGEGKDVQYFSNNTCQWIDINGQPTWGADTLYRIKPEPKMVPYGPEDGVWLVGRKAKGKNSGDVVVISSFSTRDDTIFLTHTWVNMLRLFNDYLDVTDSPGGVPFGKVVE